MFKAGFVMILGVVLMNLLFWGAIIWAAVNFVIPAIGKALHG